MSRPNKQIKVQDRWGSYDKNDYIAMLALSDDDRPARCRRLHAFLWRCIPGVTVHLIYPPPTELERCFNQLVADLKIDLSTGKRSSVGEQISEDWGMSAKDLQYPWDVELHSEKGKHWQVVFCQTAVHFFIEGYYEYKLGEEIEKHCMANVFDEWPERHGNVLESAKGVYKTLG